MRKITSLLMLLCVFVGTVWGQTERVEGLTEVPTEKVDITKGLQTGYYLLKQVNDNKDCAGGQGVGWIKAASEAAGASATSKGTGTPGEDGALYIWYVEVVDAAERTIKISTANKIASWYLPKDSQREKGLTSYASATTLQYHYENQPRVGGCNETHGHAIKEDAALISNYPANSYIHFSGDNLGTWTSCGTNSTFMVEFYQIPDANLIKSTWVNVTYKYNIDGKLYTTQVKEHVINSEPSAPAVPFLAVVDYEGTIGNADCEIVVNCKEDLPFVSSASYEKAIWQVIDIHSNENTYTWKFVAAGEPVETPVIAKSLNKMLGDEYYWAFVGNLFDGFKIYNKKAGGDLTLRKAETGNTISVMSSTDDKNQFKPYSSTAIKGTFCFKLDGDDYYLNKQAQDSKNILKGWNEADGGSSCRSFSPASFVLSTVEQFMKTEIPNGAVGSPEPQLVDAVNTAYAASKANEYDMDKLVALEAAVATLIASHNTKPTDGIYRIQNIYRKQMIGYNGKDRVKTDIGKTDVSQLWEIKTVEEGKVVVRNLNADAYMKAPSGGNTLVPEAEAAKFDLKPLGLAQYTLTIGANNLVIYGDGSLGGWSESPLGSDGAWYIIPATDIEVVVGEAGYATTYLPFAVTLPEGVKAYAVDAVEGEAAKLAEKADIPANTAAILAGEGTHTLTIAEANSDWTGNMLKGSTVNAYVQGSAYVLSNKDKGVGFYAAELNWGAEGAEGNTHFKNNANRAYLPAPAAGVRFLSFDFGTETAIDELKGENGNVKTVIYDLSGRRVQKAQKGLYIVNGVKVIK